MADLRDKTDEELLALVNKNKPKAITADDLATAPDETLQALIASKGRQGPAGPSVKATDTANARASWRPQTDSVGRAALGGLGYGAVETFAPSAMIDLAGQYVVAPAMYGMDKALTGIANTITGGNKKPDTLDEYRRRAGVTDPLSRRLADVIPMDQGKEGTWARPVSDIAELVPQAVMMKGNALKNAMVYGVAPGTTGYVADQLAKDSPYEPYAKPVTQFLTAVGGGILTDPSRGQKNIVSATKAASPEQLSEAMKVMQSAKEMGVNLTVDEALGFATQGGTSRLSNMRRIAENTGGRDVLQPFTAGRPQQTAAATERMLDSITPAPANPSNVPVLAQQAAGTAIDRVRQGINKLARPFYQSAENTPIPQKDFSALSSNSAFLDAMQKLRNSPVLGQSVQQFPDNSVGALNSLKTNYLDDAITAAKQEGRHTEAAILTKLKNQVVGVADTAAPDYATGRGIVQRGTQEVLEPLQSGPLGQIAQGGTPDSLRSAIIPQGKNVLERQNEELARAMAALSGQNPQLAKDAVRVSLGAEKNAAFRPRTSAVEGADLYGGSRFANSVGAQGQQRSNFMSTVEAVSGPQVASDAGRTLDVLTATGYRPATGSRTAFNAQDMADLRGASIANLDVTRPFARIGDFIEQARMTGKTKELSEFLTGGNVSLEQLVKLREIYPDLISDSMVKQLAGRAKRSVGFTGRAAVPAGLLAGDD